MQLLFGFIWIGLPGYYAIIITSQNLLALAFLVSLQVVLTVDAFGALPSCHASQPNPPQ
jgi:hypothetical protein